MVWLETTAETSNQLDSVSLAVNASSVFRWRFSAKMMDCGVGTWFRAKRQGEGVVTTQKLRQSALATFNAPEPFFSSGQMELRAFSSGVGVRLAAYQ